MSETAFGLLAVNNGKLLPRLRSGVNMTIATLEKVYKFMDDHPPPKPKNARQKK